jgi:L-2-hydroxyglutarate oxidase LhgO
LKTDFIIIGGYRWSFNSIPSKKNPALKVIVLEKESKIAMHQTGH